MDVVGLQRAPLGIPVPSRGSDIQNSDPQNLKQNGSQFVLNGHLDIPAGAPFETQGRR